MKYYFTADSTILQTGVYTILQQLYVYITTVVCTKRGPQMKCNILHNYSKQFEGLHFIPNYLDTIVNTR